MFLKGLLLISVLCCAIQSGFAATDKVICYFASWSVYRNSNGLFKPEDIDPSLCTHINYAFLGVNNDGTMKLLDPWAEVDLGGLQKVAALKAKNPKIKIILSIGGYNQGHALLGTVITSTTLRKRFVDSAIENLENYGYDGLDIVWEYPTAADKSNFALLLLELKQKFGSKYELSIAVPGNVIEGAYDGPAISSAVNYVHLLSFDYHGSYDGVTGHNSPLYGDPNVEGDKLNIDSSVKGWTDLGVSASKITIGLSMYGHTFTLASSADIKVGAPTTGPGIAGPYTQTPGLLGYNETTPSTFEKRFIGGRDLVRKAFLLKDIPEAALPIVMASISPNTFKQYNSSWKKWWSFCDNENIDVFRGRIVDVLKFLAIQFNSGASYGTLNSTRAALSLILPIDIGNNPIIKRFFQGIYHLRPARPKYRFTWDPSLVLTYLSQLYPNNSLTLKNLTLKLVCLLALTTAHRVQTISLIRLKNIKMGHDQIEIRIPDQIKTSAPDKYQPLLLLPYFSEKPELCVASALRCYLEKTENLRTPESDQVLITFKKPHRPATTQTISRWIKTVLKQSGIDTTVFTAHSTRHASTSAALRKGVNLAVIRNTAGWTERSLTFAKFYNRPIIAESNACFAHAILQS